MKKIGIISLIVIIIDRILKVLVTNNYALNVRNKIIDGFFYITNCHNEGAAFSLFSGNVLFLIFITLIVLFLIYRTINKENVNKIGVLAYGLLLGGILGNLYDRIFYGYVIDYLDFVIFKFNFAIFNLADAAIVIGAILLIVFEGSDNDGRKNKDRSRKLRKE
ncbi:lipoprotein signal peptidase [Clostridium sp. CAG:433]|nr:lipoprotein signal peptidase [Clostridium sp. CAG:433]